MNRFNNQVAVITGAARGIGKGVAQRMAREGAKVYLFDILEKELNETLYELRQQGFSAEGKVLDITDEGEVKQVLAQVFQANQRLDILVNCAAIVGKTGHQDRRV